VVLDLGDYDSVVTASIAAWLMHCVVRATQWQHRMDERNVAVSGNNRIEFRIGVHQGDIVVEDDDIFGDGVNVAARLEGLAEPGLICVSVRVQEDVAGRLNLTFEDLGEQKLKNIARPVRVYRVRLATAENKRSRRRRMTRASSPMLPSRWFNSARTSVP
jgi:adenylate cyclase